MEEETWLGTDKIDITPRKPIYLSGFAHRKGVCTGVSERIYLKLWYLKQREHDGKNKNLLFVQGDLIWWGSEYISIIKRRISETYNIKFASIIIHASHNHSGPQTSNRFLPSMGILDPDYMEWVIDQLICGVSEAERNLEQVTIEKGVGSCNLGVNRRKRVDGKITMAPNYNKPVDHELTVVRFKTKANKVKGILFHYACHLTVTDSNMISPEFYGVAAEKLEKLLEKDHAIVSPLQGCCGDIRPNLVKDGHFYRGNDKDVEKFATDLFKVLDFTLNHAMKKILWRKFKIKDKTIQLPLDIIPDIEAFQSDVETKGKLYGEWREFLLKNPERRIPFVTFDLTHWVLADQVEFLAMNGEIVNEYGQYIKKISENKILPLGYCNGMIGYIPTRKQLEEGGYESTEAPYYFGMPSRFNKEIEKTVKAAIKDITIENKGDKMETSVTEQYYNKIINHLEVLKNEEHDNILKAAEMLKEQIKQDKIVYAYGPGGHSNLGPQEIFFRAGGLMHISAMLDEGTLLSNGALRSMAIERTPGYGNIVVDDYNLKKGDLLILINAYGINSAVIDAALEARRRGVKIIAVTSIKHADNTPANHPARHPSKENLYQLADVVLDSKVEVGDAVVEIEGLDQKVAAMSTFANAFLLNSLVAETVNGLIKDGIVPPIWTSGNATGGDEANRKLYGKFIGRIKKL